MTSRLVLTLLLLSGANAFNLGFGSGSHGNEYPDWYDDDEFSGSGRHINNPYETPDKQDLSALMEIVDDLVKITVNGNEWATPGKTADKLKKFRNAQVYLNNGKTHIDGLEECVKYLKATIREDQIGGLETYGGETGPGFVSQNWKMTGYQRNIEGKTTLRYKKEGLVIGFFFKGK